MILPSDRRLAAWLVRFRIFYLQDPRDRVFSFRCYRLRARRGAWWIWHWMRRRQTRDGLHHAPMCPGNEWAGQELVFQACTCGANREAREARERRLAWMRQGC